jgi:hypothetical protein
MKFRVIWLTLIILTAGTLVWSQGSGTPNQLRVRTDANGYLMAAGAAQTPPYTTSTFNNTRLKTDANGNLLVASSGGIAPADATYITQTTNSGLSAEQALASLSTGLLWSTTTTGVVSSIADAAAGSILVSGSPSSWTTTPGSTTFTTTRTALGTTSTDGYVATNGTAATSMTTVQISPRIRLRGNAWDTSASQTVDFFIENLPATAATPTGTFKLGYSLNGAAASYPLTVSSAGNAVALGSFQATNNVDFGGNLRGGASSTDIVYLKTTATITSGFSTTTPTIVGTASAFAVTIKATPGITGTVAFNGTFTNVPSVSCTNTITANLVQAVPTTTQVVLNGVWVENDIIRCVTLGY